MKRDNISYFIGGIKTVIFKPARACRVFKNLVLDIKYTGHFMGIPLKNENVLTGYTNTTSTEYYTLKSLFSTVSIKDDDVIVDVGCGKGRVLAFLANYFANNKTIGIEVDASVAHKTKQNMNRYKNVEVLTEDVLESESILEGSVFYLFNPFNAHVLRKLASKIESRILNKKHQNKRIAVIYYNCCHLQVFEESIFWDIKKIGDFDGLPAAVITTKDA